MDLISEVRRILEKNHYSVVRAGESDDVVHFEDLSGHPKPANDGHLKTGQRRHPPGH